MGRGQAGGDRTRRPHPAPSVGAPRPGPGPTAAGGGAGGPVCVSPRPGSARAATRTTSAPRPVRALTCSDPREHLRKAGVALLGEDGVGLFHPLPGLVHARRQAGHRHLLAREDTAASTPGGGSDGPLAAPRPHPSLHRRGPVSGATHDSEVAERTTGSHG